MGVDLSKLSDEELQKIASSPLASKAPDLSSMSDEDLQKIASQPSALDSARIGFEKSVTFGTRPALKGFGAAQETFIKGLADGQPGEGIWDRIKRAGGSASDAFSGTRNKTIQEQDVAAKEHPIANIAGQLGGTALTAPFMAAKTIGGAAAIGGAYGAGTAIGESPDLKDAGEKIVTGAALGGALQAAAQYGPKAISWAGDKAGNLLRKTASNLQGISEKEISTYANRANEVKDMMKAAGGDISEAADQARTQITKEIQGARQSLNSKISTALTDPKFANVDVDAMPILKKLEEGLAITNGRTSQFKSEEINQLKNVIDLTKQAISQDGKLDLVTLNSLKEELQNVAKASYNNGQAIFPRGDLAAKSAKGAAAEARRLLNEVAPEIKDANNQLSKLHFIEDNMNKNMIRAGKPESALIAAGTGGNSRNTKMLQSLDAITGGSAQRQAENIAAARTFGNTPFMPADFTGKAAARIITGGGTGLILGGAPGAMIGTALTSPMTTKLALDSARLLKTITNPMLSAAGTALRSPGVQSGILKEVENSVLSGPMDRRLRLIRSGNNKSENQ